MLDNITVHKYKKDMLENITVHLYNEMLDNITVHLYKKDMLENITVHLYKDMLHNITVHLYKDMHDNQGHLNSIIVPLPFPWSKQRPVYWGQYLHNHPQE